ncbi:MAG: hypothetical protein ACE5I3_07535 [Phycisphaerae bacterium]
MVEEIPLYEARGRTASHQPLRAAAATTNIHNWLQSALNIPVAF